MANKTYKIKFKSLNDNEYIWYFYDDNSIEIEEKNPRMTIAEYNAKLALIKYVTEYMDNNIKDRLTFEKL